MKLTLQRHPWLLFAALSAAAAALYVLFGSDASTALPALAVANAGGALDIKQIIDAIKGGLDDFKTKTQGELHELRGDLDRLESRGNLHGLVGADGKALEPAGAQKLRLSNGKEALLLSKSARLAPHVAKSGAGHAGDELSLGEFVAGHVLGRKAVDRAPELVVTGIAANVIDDVRAQTVIVQAGAPTLVIPGPMKATRITGDATVHQHTEGADDVTQSDVSTDGVALDPKALVARVPLTAELVEDSANLDQVLRIALASAFAVKLDALSLATIIADANVPKSAAGQDPALWLKCLEAVGAAMAAKQPLPTAMICNTADFIARASQQASTAGSWLGKPPALATMAELPTTAITAGTALYGGFDAAFLVVLRQELRFEVLRFADAGRYSHELVAHMRADGVLVQPKRIFKQLKTV